VRCSPEHCDAQGNIRLFRREQLQMKQKNDSQELWLSTCRQLDRTFSCPTVVSLSSYYHQVHLRVVCLLSLIVKCRGCFCNHSDLICDFVFSCQQRVGSYQVVWVVYHCSLSGCCLLRAWFRRLDSVRGGDIRVLISKNLDQELCEQNYICLWWMV